MRRSHRKQGIEEEFLLANSAMGNRFKGQYCFHEKFILAFWQNDN
jgi:hypothetical protein